MQGTVKSHPSFVTNSVTHVFEKLSICIFLRKSDVLAVANGQRCLTPQLTASRRGQTILPLLVAIERRGPESQGKAARPGQIERTSEEAENGVKLERLNDSIPGQRAQWQLTLYFCSWTTFKRSSNADTHRMQMLSRTGSTYIGVDM